MRKPARVRVGPSPEANTRGPRFTFHVYDRLWENITSRDARIWNYLAFYGAALAILFGVGSRLEENLELLIVALILTAWACLLVLSSNWWFTRNLLFITRVEKIDGGDVIDRIIPVGYRDLEFDFEGAYRASFVIFTVLWLTFFLGEMMPFALQDKRMHSAYQVIAFLVTILGLTFAAKLLITKQRRYISQYYDAKRELEVTRLASEEGSGTVDRDKVAPIDRTLNQQKAKSLAKHGLTPPLFYAFFSVVLAIVLPAGRQGPIALVWFAPTSILLLLLSILAQERALAYSYVAEGLKKSQQEAKSKAKAKAKITNWFRQTQGGDLLSRISISVWASLHEPPRWIFFHLAFITAVLPAAAALVTGKLPPRLAPEPGLGYQIQQLRETESTLRNLIDELERAGASKALLDRLAAAASKDDLATIAEQLSGRFTNLEGTLQTELRNVGSDLEALQRRVQAVEDAIERQRK